MAKKYRYLPVIVCAVLAAAAVLAALLVPRYWAVYHSPAIRYAGMLYLPEDGPGAARVYAAEKNRVTLEPAETGTDVTLDFFPYPAQTWRVCTDGVLTTVYNARGEAELSGVWRDGELTVPDTGETVGAFRWTAPDTARPSAAQALCLLHAEGIRGRGGERWPYTWMMAGVLPIFLFLGLSRNGHVVGEPEKLMEFGGDWARLDAWRAGQLRLAVLRLAAGCVLALALVLGTVCWTLM